MPDVLRASGRYPLVVGGAAVGVLDAGAALRLVWPPWYPSSSEDRARDAATLVSLDGQGFLQPGTLRRWLDDDWGATGEGRSLAGGSGDADVRAASAQLAAAVTSGSSAGWRYGLGFAGSQALAV